MYKQPTKHEHRENLSVRVSRASELGNFRLYTFQNSYFFQCLSWYLRILSVCLSDTLLQNVLTFCAVFLYTWHYKRLTNCRQDTHIKIIYVCEPHSCIQNVALLFLSLFIFVLQIFCRYNMTFNHEILGGGMVIQAIPPPKIFFLGIYPPIPPPPGSTPMPITYTISRMMGYD